MQLLYSPCATRATKHFFDNCLVVSLHNVSMDKLDLLKQEAHPYETVILKAVCEKESMKMDIAM